MAIYIYDGKILVVNGDIAANEACCCGGGGECPSSCDDTSYILTLSLSSGGACSGCDSEYSTDWDLYQVSAGACSWYNDDMWGEPYEILIDVWCEDGEWKIEIYLNCIDIYGTYCYYEDTLTGSIGAKADPTGTYTLTGSTVTGTGVISIV